MKDILLNEFEITSKELLHVLAHFRQEDINTIPFANSWSAAQVADHLLKSDELILQTLHGPFKNSNRAPDERVAGLKNTFLDFNNKMIASDNLKPRDLIFSKQELVDSLARSRAQMNDNINASNLSNAFDHPVFGDITRLELLYFVVFHTQRHIRQLKNIFVSIPLDSGNSFPY